MFAPRSYRVTDRSVLHAMMRVHGFGTLVSAAGGEQKVTHMPFQLDAGEEGPGTLVWHLARANPQSRDFDGTNEAVAVFAGPHAYVSPNWYQRPEQVPTWNYAAVHAHGVPRLVEDTALIRHHLATLTDKYEASRKPRWRIARIEADMNSLMKALATFAMPIQRLEGTFKFSQNKSRADRTRIAQELEASPDPASHAAAAIMWRDLQGLPLMEED